MGFGLGGENEASKIPQIVAAFGACFGAFGLGTGLSWTSPTLPVISENSDGICADEDGFCYWDDPKDAMTADEASWVGGLFNIGAMLSALATGYCMEIIGRKWTMLAMVVPFVAGWVILTMAGPLELTDAWWFYAGRLLTGFGGGAFALAAPIYIAETSEPSIRGSLGSLMQFMLTVGVLFNNGVGALIEWDILTGLCLIFPVLLAGIIFFMPESPYYLVTKGKEAEARKALQWLRGSKYDIEDEYREMVETHQRQQEIGTISLKEFCSKGYYLKPGLIMIALMFFQQYSGINAVLFYLTDIFIKADVGLSSGASATIVTLVQVIATGIAVLVVEKFGRKLLLILSAALMCVSIVSLGTFFYLDENKECDYGVDLGNGTTTAEPCNPDKAIDPDTVDSLGWLPLTALIIYIFAFSIGFGPLPWMMNGEFFSLESKAIASTIACAFNWFCAFMVSKFEVNIEDGINTSGAYWLYGSICAVAVVFILFLVPETRGKTPEEMKAYFRKKK